MKDWEYHFMNSAIAGALVILGSLTPLLAGDFNWKNVFIGFASGFIAGLIVFLNKFNDWFKLQDPDMNEKFLRKSLLNFL